MGHFGRPSAEVLQRKNIQAEWADGMALLPHVVAATPAGQIANYEVGAGSSEVRRGNLRAKNVILRETDRMWSRSAISTCSAAGSSTPSTTSIAPW